MQTRIDTRTKTALTNHPATGIRVKLAEIDPVGKAVNEDLWIARTGRHHRFSRKIAPWIYLTLATVALGVLLATYTKGNQGENRPPILWDAVTSPLGGVS